MGASIVDRRLGSPCLSMNFYSATQFVVFVGIVTVLVNPLGGYMEKVFLERRTALDRLCVPVERAIYRVAGVDRTREMCFREYASCFVFFGLACTLVLYAILRLQRFLPWYFPAYDTTVLSRDLAMNTAVSFSTTTTWQAYSGETTMSYFSQMAGLCAQNFLAGAAGLAAGVAFIRGMAREVSETLGNFWVGLTRALLWILLPGVLVGVLLLRWRGVPMNFAITLLQARWRGASRYCRRVRWQHLRSSRTWGPMAEDFYAEIVCCARANGRAIRRCRAEIWKERRCGLAWGVGADGGGDLEHSDRVE